MCLVSWSHELTASRPTLAVIGVHSGVCFCQVYSSTYSLHFVFPPILHVSVFLCIRAYLMLFEFSLLNGLLLIWLFASLISKPK